MKADDHQLRWEIVPFFHGNILDISEGRGKCFPHFVHHIDARISEPDKLGVFTNNSFDGVFSSNVLHLLPEDMVLEAITEWSRIIKDGGHIILNLPKAHDKAKWEVSRESIVAHVAGIGRGFDLAMFMERDEDYICAFKLVDKGGQAFSCDAPKPEKTCAVVRLGAFGDMIQASSIFPGLKAQGYHVTLYCSESGHNVVLNDPHIDRFIIQGTDEVPPQVLGEFWDYTKNKYDKWVNLSESVECTLLAAPGHTNHGWPDAVRAKYMDVNYLEFTHELAEVPPPYRPKFYSTVEERAWAKDKARSYGKRNILWSLSGSSVHKTWPHLDAVVAAIMLNMPDVHVVMVGDELSQILEAGWEKERRVHRQSGQWSIRESMAFAEVADLIIGTETGLLNAAGSMDTPKIVTLSHSSEKMLTKHWKNVINLKQPEGVGCKKFPCRMMHYDWTYCPSHEDEHTKAALCQYHIGPDEMMKAIVSVLGQRQLKVA